MRRVRQVTAGTPWEVCKDLASESNLWFFIDEDVKGTVRTASSLIKSRGIRGGAVCPLARGRLCFLREKELASVLARGTEEENKQSLVLVWRVSRVSRVLYD
eukprot:3939273-Rhodomonas_salina.2